MTYGLLHTAASHVATFDQLIDEVAGPDTPRVHVVDDVLLADAIENGAVDEGIRDRLRERLLSFPSTVDRVLCTCSTLAPAAELMSSRIGVEVLRVDRPMARVGVESGMTIGVAYSVSSTISPTSALIAEEAMRANHSVELVMIDCTHTWPAFVAGDQEGYIAGVVGAVEAASDRVDVVLLAQASMAEAGERLYDLPVPVLSSPRLAVLGLIDGMTFG